MANALKLFGPEITLTVKQFGTLTLQNDDLHKQCLYPSSDIKVKNSRKLKWTGWERKVLGTTEIKRPSGKRLDSAVRKANSMEVVGKV